MLSQLDDRALAVGDKEGKDLDAGIIAIQCSVTLTSVFGHWVAVSAQLYDGLEELLPW